ncbi:MAG: chloride channel protein [Pseudomonadota bacterium]
MLDLASIVRLIVVTLAGALIGMASSLVAAAFVWVVIWANDLLLLTSESRLAPPRELVIAATLIVPTLGGLAVGLMITRGVKGGLPLGPADAILAVQIRQPMPDRKSGIIGTLASLTSLCTGASVGQYGPLVYLGAAIGAQVRRLEKRLRDIRSIAIACGVAGAIAAAFNAPIAGLIFAHEVILRHYALRAFAPVALAASAGHVTAYTVFGEEPILGVELDVIFNHYEFFFFAAEGALAAFVATAYMALILAFGRLSLRLPIPRALRTALAGLGLGLVALQVPEVLGIGSDALLKLSVEGAYSVAELAVLVVAKTFVTALCIGFGFAGGVFSPALLIGGFAGALYGLVLAAVLPVDLTGVIPYAICGMMAVASPVIGAPLTTILIVFELTRNYDLTIAVMTSVAFSNLIAHRIFGRSLFHVQMGFRGHDLSQGRDRAILSVRLVSEFLSQDFATLSPDDDVQKIEALCQATRRSEVLLVDGEGRYHGHVRLQDTFGEARDRKLHELADHSEIVFDETTSVWEAMSLLQGFVGDAVPLVNSDRRLMGIIPESAVIRGYMESTRDLRREENAGV